MQGEINDTVQYFAALLEERKAEVLRELENNYLAKQAALGGYTQKAQETVEKMYQVCVKEIMDFEVVG